MIELHSSVAKVQETLRQSGFDNQVEQLPDSTRTAQEAADTIGCEVAQIAKSIIFRLKPSDRPVLAVASGVNRVSEQLVEAHVDGKLGKADAAFVNEHTGYVIGGVPPIGHSEPIVTFIDEDLFRFHCIWAAAGHPKAVFQLTPDELAGMTKGKVIRVVAE
ncbi:cys-tRNA(pro)/cys-tRNA(cys) deacylase [Sporosarcina sp. NCCP-2716]|uniref:YbaK/EbsC family protein n=1 Tax=Sporosarcina sp. NCCP-2716 TaxID=2943679 RepID=UPI00204125A3|nr:YbaK/EbsC family protein [Sporosarcina sp. NCCP-2716]GKV68643.1 cys-tRNA(pro)/cys-tRNA(cys) deacylase [Sporosarcina sp. NCCP-2716]